MTYRRATAGSYEILDMAARISVSSRQVLTVILAGFALRIGLALATDAVGLGHDPLFFKRSDIFADSLKSALAQRSITTPLLTDPRVDTWAPLFRDYLFNNPYLGGHLTIQHSPPLAMLELIGVALLIRSTSPFTSLATIFCAYVAASVFAISAVCGKPVRALWPILLVPVVSFPAIYMMDRANYLSGFTSLGVLVYLLAISSGRLRALGFVAMAIAINFRPNIAVVTLLEFAIADRSMIAVRSIAIQAAITLAIAVSALFVVHSVDAAYTPTAFLEGLRRYNDIYITGDAGLLWNDSLPGAVRSLWRIAGAEALDLGRATFAAAALGISALVATIIVIISRRVTLIETAFLVLALSTLFTPVYGEYHALVFAGPILIAAQTDDMNAKFDARAVFLATTVLIGLCFLVWLRPSIPTSGLLVLGAILIPALDWLRRVRTVSRDRGEALVLATSLLVLCPLGGGLTNGIAVSTLLMTTFVIVCGEACFRRSETIDVPVDFVSVAAQTAVYNGKPLL